MRHRASAVRAPPRPQACAPVASPPLPVPVPLPLSPAAPLGGAPPCPESAADMRAPRLVCSAAPVAGEVLLVAQASVTIGPLHWSHWAGCVPPGTCGARGDRDRVDRRPPAAPAHLPPSQNCAITHLNHARSAQQPRKRRHWQRSGCSAARCCTSCCCVAGPRPRRWELCGAWNGWCGCCTELYTRHLRLQQCPCAITRAATRRSNLQLSRLRRGSVPQPLAPTCAHWRACPGGYAVVALMAHAVRLGQCRAGAMRRSGHVRAGVGGGKCPTRPSPRHANHRNGILQIIWPVFAVEITRVSGRGSTQSYCAQGALGARPRQRQHSQCRIAPHGGAVQGAWPAVRGQQARRQQRGARRRQELERQWQERRAARRNGRHRRRAPGRARRVGGAGCGAVPGCGALCPAQPGGCRRPLAGGLGPRRGSTAPPAAAAARQRRGHARVGRHARGRRAARRAEAAAERRRQARRTA